MTMQQAHILVVDDESNIRLTLSTLLTRAGYAVTTAANGEEALNLLKEHEFALLLVDLKMPGIDGMQVVAAARERQPDISVIVLTGHGSLETALDGIRQQIFDYLLKTTDPNYVVERVKAGLVEFQRQRRQNELIDTMSSAMGELRRHQQKSGADSATGAMGGSEEGSDRVIAIGQLQIDTWRQAATFAGQLLPLTPTEFRVLLCMAEHVGKMLTYAQIVRCAQGYDTSELEASELIKPHIYHLRQKLEPDPTTPRHLLNVRGKGYMLQM
ncbi:MAG: response regulator transcription factor [Chloroflexaceae bacterium]|nr:response regulator transcription factor [Chloroflexaceae bacterium]NJL33368.1 response regulator transcription factor [Chloroflexaceae bacterium]NJO04188.1 response regulator transcription factor [Chloroflexaceae bacterium]